MKTLGLLLASVAEPMRDWNVRIFVRLLAVLVVLVGVYSAVFLALSTAEGQEHSWVTAVYWVLTVMSTLGFGDITFDGDVGRAFSVLVLVTGASFILVLLPFAFIQFVFAPWMEARQSARAPRDVDEGVSGHIVLTNLDPVTDELIQRARAAGTPTVLLVPDVAEALRLHDLGYEVMRGELDDPETYRRARVADAALVATTRADTTNTNVAFTVREMAEHVQIVATASRAASVDVLELAGCDQVLQLGVLLGQALARRVLGGDQRSHVIGNFGDLLIAEANVDGTDLVGRRIQDLDLRAHCGVNIIGVWQRGVFERVDADTELRRQTVIILAGSEEDLRRYDERYGTSRGAVGEVIVIGGGRVGRAAAAALAAEGVDCTIIEQDPDRIHEHARYVQGDAAELEVLQDAGLERASAALITTHDDDVNVYLTLYLRRLRPDLQVIARAVVDRNVGTLHRAGADAVLSYASLGAAAIWNASSDADRLIIAEGLEVFEMDVPDSLIGRSLADADIGAETGCTVVALKQDGRMQTDVDPAEALSASAQLVVIADGAAERRLMRRHPSD
jgi:voltage-gated potassium channel